MTSIIILTFNKIEYTKKCIESIRKYTLKDSYEIIVVDNASTDESIKWLKKQEDIKLILNEKNLGFPRGCNQGIEIASGSEILLLNNDVIVTPKWLENMLISLYSNSNIGAVGPRTNYAFGQEIEAEYKYEKDINAFAKKFSENKKITRKLKLSGFCFLIKKEVLDKIGLLDELFTLGNCEDDDLSLRIIKNGYELGLCENVFIHHFGSVSFKENIEKSNALLMENKEKFEKKWGINLDYSMRSRVDLISLMNLKIDNLNILEIGSACGQTILDIKNVNQTANVFAIEKDKNLAEIAYFFADVVVGDVETIKLNYKEKFFDYIIMGDVLECIYNPELLLEKIYPYLKDNGELIVSIKNVQHFSIVSNLLNGKWNYEENDILHSDSIRFFTFHEFEKLINRCGYIIKFFSKNFSEYEENYINLVNKISLVTSDEFKNENFVVYQWLFRVGKDIFLSKEVQKNIIDELSNFDKSEINNSEILLDLLINNNVSSEQVVYLAKKNTINTEKVLVSLAIELVKSDYTNQGIKLLIESYKVYPESLDVISTLAYLLNITGNNEGAMKILKTCKIKNNKSIIELLTALK